MISELNDFAMRYTAAWCSQNPDKVSSFFDLNGTLQINDGPAAIGRPEISAVAQSFMAAFPDLCVALDQLRIENGVYEYHWTLTGTNTGPGGTGRKVRLSGFEVWRLGDNGLIASSHGHFDAADYSRQLESQP